MELILAIAGVAVGAVSVALTVHFARKADRANRARKSLDWHDLLAASNDLAQRIKRECTPAAIVTPGLRGATFANLLASEFVGQPPVYVGVSTWKREQHGAVFIDDAIEIETKKWSVAIPRAVTRHPDGDILIVDDFVMSGDFLDRLRDELVRAGVDQQRIRSASIAATRVAIKNHKAPDYYWWTADDDDFFFPWGKAR